MNDSSATKIKKKGKRDEGGIKLKIGDQERVFDIDAKKLPGWVKDNALTAGGYPYDQRMPKDEYEDTLERLQIELVKLQSWMQESGERVLAIFEGRDTAGKGGAIQRLRQYMNPRAARYVALPKPSESERGQWYFQRYVAHFPGAGEFVTFDRSWYNRAGVERVMGYCTEEQYQQFLRQAPMFERMLVNSGLSLVKLWFSVSRGEQRSRFIVRQIDPVRQWKLSPTDLASLDKWDEYTEAKEMMFLHTDTADAPWTVIKSNDKKRARLEALRFVLSRFEYTGKDADAIGVPDPRIVGSAADVLEDDAVGS